MNEKGRQTKLLAAIAILAMVVCVFAAVMPSGVNGETIAVAANGDIQDAINQANPGDTVLISGTEYGNDDDTDGYAVYTVDKAITITSNNATKPVIYGSFWVITDGVTISNLNIIPYGNGVAGDDNNQHKNGISFYGDEITVQNCSFSLRSTGTDQFANGISIFPKTNFAANWTITGNTFTGFNATSGTWETCAIVIADNFSAPRFGTNVVTKMSGVDGNDLMEIYKANTFSNNNFSIVLDNWNGGASSGVSGIYIVDTGFYCGENYTTYVPEGKTVDVGSETISGTLYLYGAITGTLSGGDGTIYNFTNATVSGVTNVKESVQVSGDGVQTAFTNGADAVFATGTVSNVNIPAGKEIFIDENATLSGTITLNGDGTNNAVANVSSSVAQSGTIRSGATGPAVQLNSVIGSVVVTYGSVNSVIDLQGGSITIVGEDSNLDTSDGTISGTIGSNSTVIINSNATISLNDSLIINGALYVQGLLRVESGSSITVNGTLSVSGTSGDVRVDNSATFVIGEDGMVNGVSAKEAAGSNFKNAHIYSTISNAVAKNETVLFINGVYSNDDVVDVESANVTVSLAEGATYTGSVTYQFETGTQTPVKHTNSVTFTAAYSEDAAQIINIQNNVLTVSNATITSITGCDQAAEIILDSVKIESLTLNSAVTIDGTSEISVGEILTFDVGGSIKLNDTESKLYVYGDVQKTTGLTTAAGCINNVSGTVYYTAQNFRNVAAVVTTDVDGSNIDHLVAIGAVGVNDSTFEENVYPGSIIYLTSNITIDTYVELENVTVYTNGFNITVGGTTTAGTLVLTNSTVDRDYAEASWNSGLSGQTNREMIIVNNGSSLEITDSLLFIEVSVSSGASVDVDNADVTYDSTTSEVRVGYGTTLYFSSNAVSNIDVYGNLVIDSNATVPATCELNVWSGATMTVNGNVTALGDVTFYAGSDVTVAEGATFTLGDRNGGAEMVVDGNVTVETGATFVVTGVSNTAVTGNSLDITSSGDDAFTVEGTMNMNGALSGAIQDKGTITFNGSSTDGVIVIYSGVILTINSVATVNDGSLTVTDAGITDVIAPNKASNGNAVVLQNVKGITITETVTPVNWVDSDRSNHRDYVSIMDISGTITSGSIDVTTSVEEIQGVGEHGNQYAKVTVSGELVLGKDVTLFVSGTLDVSGTIAGTVADSDNNNAEKITINKVNKGGVLTVTGTVTTVKDIAVNGTLNAVWYVVTGTENETYTYTNFVDAVRAASGADEDTIYVVGAVTASADVEVPAGIIVEIADGDKLTIASEVTVTIADGATVNGSRATIDVNGTLTANDYAEDMNVRTIEADVVTTNGAVRTWTSLANAIAGAQPGDVITANAMITITSDLTIPEGVTVYTEYPFVVDGATLTIEGTLQMDDKAQNTVTSGNVTYSGLMKTEDEDSEVTVSGILSIETLGAPAQGVYVGDDITGAHFAINNGAFVTTYVSNVAYAAQTASNNINLADGVTIKGIVAAGDVTFTAPEDGSITVTVQQMNDTDAGMTILTMGTITLAGDAQFEIADDNSRVTGTVAALCGDGTATASVVLDAVMGGAATDFTISANSAEVTDGYEYELGIAGTYTGDVTVSAGEVIVTETITMGDESTMIVASGATMTIETDGQIAVSAGDDGETFVVDGEIVVKNDNAFTGNAAVINGTMTTDDLTLTTVLRVTGTLNVNDNETLIVGNNGKLILGDKPSVLGAATTGAVAGTVTIQSGGYILAYTGADLSAAEIDVNPATGESDADSTVYYINKEAYATVITADANSAVKINGINGADSSIELNGMVNNGTNDTIYWFETAAEAESAYTGTFDSNGNVNTDDVGDYAEVYTVFDAAMVQGTFSVGQGITLYIDGLVYNPYISAPVLAVGTHDVSIQANTGYTIENATITFNGEAVQNGGTITVTADMNTFVLAASGAEPADQSITIEGGNGGSDEMSLTDYLLIILVILIVIMAIMVAFRLMRS